MCRQGVVELYAKIVNAVSSSLCSIISWYQLLIVSGTVVMIPTMLLIGGQVHFHMNQASEYIDAWKSHYSVGL